jgi:hypothetical protein
MPVRAEAGHDEVGTLQMGPQDPPGGRLASTMSQTLFDQPGWLRRACEYAARAGAESFPYGMALDGFPVTRASWAATMHACTWSVVLPM